jgi:cytosine/adenosine deaminase-related metal-dependent hydrolase
LLILHLAGSTSNHSASSTKMSILLQGGTLLVHDDNDHVSAIEADVLIDGQYISKIAKGIKAPDKAKIVDCQNKILSPGFVNTHLHTWETQLKGRIEDGLLLDYMVNGTFADPG